MFRRGATHQARVFHPRVQAQPVHHVVDAEEMHSVFNDFWGFVKKKKKIVNIASEELTYSRTPRGFLPVLALIGSTSLQEPHTG